ncbi:MAG: alcohol dehydrogenase catalytic domain-containing protein [Actinomycetota bacterium]
MRAAVWAEARSPALVEEVDLAVPGPGEVRVEVEAAGVCHSDLHLALGHFGKGRFPTVLGHEGAGVVTEVGAGVTEVGIGDRVTFCFIPSCGECRQCRKGHPNLCEPGSAASFAGTMLDGGHRMHLPEGRPLRQFLAVGAFAQATVVPERSVVRMPEGLPFEQAALVGCAVLTGYGAVRNAGRVSPGDRVAVIGCGGVGMQVIGAARLAGAESITAVDPVEGKREPALEQGATAFATPETVGGPFDLVFEVVGRAETIELGWRILGSGGTVVVVGIAPAGVEARIRAIDFSFEKTLRGSFYGSGDPRREIADLARLVAEGTIDLTRTVSHRTDLAGINEAFARMERGEGARTIVVP